MEEAVPTFSPFSLGGHPARAKFLVPGPAGSALADRSRSLNLEHVSAAALLRQEISRRTPAGRLAGQAGAAALPPSDEATLAPLRRWFWTRKPDAGFVLTDFPATLLQALVFDEWLESRGTALTAVLVTGAPPPSGASDAILDHYRTRGVDVVEAASLLAG